MSSLDWNFIQASDYCNSVIDGTHDSPKSVETGKFLITSKHIKGQQIDFENAYLISHEDYEKINKRSQVNQWDVIISMIGEYCGFCYIEKNKIIEYAIKNVGVFKTGNELNAKWLYYYLNSRVGKNFIFAGRSGSSQPYLSLGTLRSLPILIPPNEKIKRNIVNFLSILDAKIDVNNRINAELEKLAKTIYDYWFVQFDFPNKDGKPYKASGGKMVYNDQLKREIPADWQVKELSDIAEIVMGQSPSGNSYNINKLGEIFFQGSTDFSNRFPTIRQFTTEPNRMAKKGDILLSVRAPVGTLNIANSNCCIGRGLAALRSRDGFNSYLFYVMQYFKKVFDHRDSVGTTFGSITKDDLFSLQLVYPEKRILQQYQSIVGEHDKKILNNHQQNQQLTQLRDWLLPLLMNGQVRVE